MSGRKRIIIFSTVLIGIFLTTFTTTSVTTASPAILTYFGKMGNASLVFASYMMTFTIAIPIFGKLSDKYSKRKLYLLGMIIFLIGSLSCGASESIIQLILSEIFGGIGGGMVTAVSVALVSSIFPLTQKGKYLGIVASLLGVSSIFGPGLGGLLVDNLGWRWVFWINIPLGLGVVIIFTLIMKKGEILKTDPQKSIGLVNLIFFTITFLAVIFTLNFGKDYIPSASKLFIAVVFLCILFLSYVIFEVKSGTPVISFTMFKSGILSISILNAVLVSIVMYIVVVYVPLFAQGVMGKNPSYLVVLVTPMTISLIISGYLSGAVISKTGRYKLITLTSFICLLAGTLFLCFMNKNSSTLLIATDMFVLGVGVGLAMPVPGASVQNVFSSSQMGSVLSLILFSKNIFGTLGVGIMDLLMNIVFSTKASKMCVEISPETQFQMLFDNKLAESIKSTFSLYSGKNIEAVLETIKSSMTISLRAVFIASFVLSLLGIVTTLFLKEENVKKSI